MNKLDLQNKTGEVWDELFSHLFQYVKDHNNKVELCGYAYGIDISFGMSGNLYTFEYLYINDNDELMLHYQMRNMNGKTTEHDASNELFTLDDLSLIINIIKE